MRLARTTLAIVALLLIVGWPALAGPQRPGKEPAAQREARRFRFDNRERAERFVDALNYVLGCRGKRPQLEVTLLDDGAVGIEGPPHLLHHATALIGLDDEPGRERRPRGGNVRNAGRPERRESRRHERGPELEVRVFDLAHARARSLVKLVEMLRVGSPEPWVAERDDRTNTIIVKGTPQMVAAAGRLIEQLDRPAVVADPVAVIKLVPLTHAEARNLAEVVGRVSRYSFQSVEIVPDPWTNTLVLAGPNEQVTQAASLIKSLDTSPDAAKTKKKPKPEAGKSKKKPKPPAGAAKGNEARADAPKARGEENKAKDKTAKPKDKESKSKAKKKTEQHEGRPADQPSTDV